MSNFSCPNNFSGPKGIFYPAKPRGSGVDWSN